jgi:multidrug efflux pump
LKPLGERRLSAQRVTARLRDKLQSMPGLSVLLVPTQDVRVGARQGKSDYQFTLWGTDLGELRRFAPLVADRLRTIPGIVDVSTDQEAGGLQADVVIDRSAAARLGISIQDIVNALNVNALNDAFSQRQVATIYGERNQYRVILGVEPSMGRAPEDLTKVFVPTSHGGQLPLSAVTSIGRSLAPLVVNHQGQFAAVTISYSLAPGASLGEATAAIRAAVAGMAIPETLHAEFAGDAAVFAESSGSQTVLVVSALIAIYILLGVLYESLLHPLTILSTLPSAGLGLNYTQDKQHRSNPRRIHRYHPADRDRKKERYYVDRPRPGSTKPGRTATKGCNCWSRMRAFPANLDDHNCGDARCAAVAPRRRPRIRAAPSAWYYCGWRSLCLTDSYALHHACNLSHF